MQAIAFLVLPFREAEEAEEAEEAGEEIYYIIILAVPL